MKKVTFRIPQTAHRLLKTEAARKATTLNNVVIEALELYLRRKEEKNSNE